MGSSDATSQVHLVSCVSQKRDRIAEAKDLYCSDWFLKARRYVEAQGGPWFILSARHGVLHPDTPISPYDITLAAMDHDQRRKWGRTVGAELTRLATIFPKATFVVLAGRLYRESVMDALGQRAIVPMEGLGIGEQKSWLLSRLSAAA